MNAGVSDNTQILSDVALAIINYWWSIAVYLINTTNTTAIEVPVHVVTAIGDSGVAILADRFRCMIGSPVDMLRNDATGHVSIHPCNAVQQAALPRTGLPKAVAKEQVARPPNAFILYRQKHHPILKAEYPDLHNNQISVILGTQWKKESQANKAPFVALAKRLKAQHMRDHPGYHYQPRKPGEKKRRRSRQQAQEHPAEATPSFPADQTNSVTSNESEGGNGTPKLAETSSPEQGNLLELPSTELSVTEGGNHNINLGDPSLVDSDLEAMLANHNDNLQPVTVPNPVAAQSAANNHLAVHAQAANASAAHAAPLPAVNPPTNSSSTLPIPVIVHEPFIDAGQLTAEMFDSFFDWDAYTKNNALPPATRNVTAANPKDMADLGSKYFGGPDGIHSEESLLADFDAKNAYLVDAEAYRQQQMNQQMG